MSARTLTDFTSYIDRVNMVPRGPITTIFDQVVNDQQFCLELENLLASDCFGALGTTNGVLGTATRFRVRGRDLCGVAATENGVYYIKAWASNATTNFTVAMNRGAGDVTLAVTTNQDQKIWRGPVTFSINSDSTVMSVDVKSRRDSGAGTVYVGGIALFSGS